MVMQKMSEEARAHAFSEHHQRHVRTTFQYVDKLLSEAEHTITNFADMYRGHFEVATDSDLNDVSGLQNDLRVLHGWGTVSVLNG